MTTNMTPLSVREGQEARFHSSPRVLCVFLALGAVLLTACSETAAISPEKERNSTASTARAKVKSEDKPVFHFDLSDPADPRVRQGTAAELSKKAAAEQQQIMSDPAFKQRQERLQVVVARGMPLVAIQKAPLADDAAALVISDPGSAVGRMIVVSEATLTDDVLARARLALLTHELRPDSDGEKAQLTLSADGRVKTTTATTTTESQPEVRLFNQGRKELARAIREHMASVPQSRVAGVGDVKLIDLNTLRRSRKGG